MPPDESGPRTGVDGDHLEQIERREIDVQRPTPEVVRHGGTFDAFRHRDYGVFWGGALVSNVGSWMQMYALAIVVYAFRRSELDLGIVNFLSGIPVLCLALIAGDVADRWDRRRLIMWGQGTLMAQAAALGWLYSTGQLSSRAPLASLLWVSSLGLLGGVVSALTFPSWQSILPDLVPQTSLLNAIALNSAQFQGARLLGPLVASGLVLAGAGMGQIFYINSASFLFVIGALALVTPRPEQHVMDDAHEGPLSRLTAGLRYARTHRGVGLIILTTALLTVFGMPYMMLLPAVADKALGMSGAHLQRAVSYLMAANGLGAVAGALIVASLPRTVRRERLVRFTVLGFALLLVAFAMSRTLGLSLVVSALAGAALLTTNSLTNTSIQACVPGHLRGRVMALFIMAFMGIMPISSIVFGALGKAIGPSNAIATGALVLAAWAVVLVWRPGLLEPEGPC